MFFDISKNYGNQKLPYIFNKRGYIKVYIKNVKHYNYISSLIYQRTNMKRKTSVKDSFADSTKLHTQGYQIYKNTFDFSEEFLNEVFKQSIGCKTIFNYNSDKKEDYKRKMRDLSQKRKCVKSFVDETTDILSEIAPQLNPNTWVILKSLPGCQAQAAHTDYLPNDDLKKTTDETMPLLAIISLMDGTKIDVWPNSIRLITNAPMLEGFHSKNVNTPVQSIKSVQNGKKVEYLNKGDMLIFRGDLIHAGSAYDVENIRLHVYLDSPIVSHVTNRVNFITF